MPVEPLVHTGPTWPQRIVDAESPTRFDLTPLGVGLPLFDALHTAVQACGERFGSVDLFGGTLEPLSYCIPADPTPERAVSFSPPQHHDRVTLLVASGVVGMRHGERFCHVHAAWVQADGQLRAGHLFPETVIGDPPPWALVGATGRIRWESCEDPETNMPTFAPSQQKGETHMPEPCTARTVVARVLPNEQVEEAITRLCADHQLRTAYLRGGSGSLIGAVFAAPDGTLRTADAPATEVVALVGLITDGRPQQLHAVVVDKHGQVQAGALAPGENKVAVTLEIVLQEVITAPMTG